MLGEKIPGKSKTHFLMRDFDVPPNVMEQRGHGDDTQVSAFNSLYAVSPISASTVSRANRIKSSMEYASAAKSKSSTIGGRIEEARADVTAVLVLPQTDRETSPPHATCGACTVSVQ